MILSVIAIMALLAYIAERHWLVWTICVIGLIVH